MNAKERISLAKKINLRTAKFKPFEDLILSITLQDLLLMKSSTSKDIEKERLTLSGWILEGTYSD